MASKKLHIPTTNFNYGAAAVQPVAPVSSANPFPSKGRSFDRQKKQDGQEEWKQSLPAYDFRVKSGKKMELPKRDDSLFGGYRNMGTRMSHYSAKAYMEAKEAEDARRAEERAKKNEQFDPFRGLF